MSDPATISAIVMGVISVIGAVSLFFNRLHIKKCITCCCKCECSSSSNSPSRVNSPSNTPTRITFSNNSTTSL